MKRHVALLGFMAAGKSTAGKRLAQRLGCAFYDTDEAVVRRHGAIAEIFKREGEAAFRSYEATVLSEILRGEPGVVALGGGTLIDDCSAAALQGRAYRIFIKVSPQRSLERLQRSRHVRPLLGSRPTLDAVEAMYRRRMSAYDSADYAIDADELEPSQIADRLAAWLHRNGIAP